MFLCILPVTSRHDHQEFISAVTRHIVLRKTFFQSIRYRADSFISPSMSIAIIQLFEMVNIQEQNAQFLLIQKTVFKHILQITIQASLIIESGQFVMIRLIQQPVSLAFLFLLLLFCCL